MGLIARDIERHGIPTVTLSSARSITEAVRPPRSVFLDYPLGHTAGPPDDRGTQRRIMIDTLSALDGILEPGTIRDLPYPWVDDAWKATAMRPGRAGDTGGGDARGARLATPQYQCQADQRAAEATPDCPGCVFPDA